MRTTFSVALLVFGVASATFAQPVAPDLSVAAMTDFQREAISSVRDITLQLILLAVGVFALMGGFVSGEKRTFTWVRLGWTSFVFLGLSVVVGLLAYGNLIHMLGNENFDLFGPIRTLAAAQWLTFGLGGLLFMLFVLLNMKRRA